MSNIRNTIFHEHTKLAKSRIEDLKKYISKKGEDYYIKVQDSGDDDIEIIMGKRKFLLEYYIDVKENKTIFVTSQIIKSESNYGSYKQTAVSDLSFEIDQFDEVFFRIVPALITENIQVTQMHNFAHDYFLKLEGLFTTL